MELQIGKVFRYKGKPIYMIFGTPLSQTADTTNFWYWKGVRMDGTLGPLRKGYNDGQFTAYPGHAKVTTTLVLT